MSFHRSSAPSFSPSLLSGLRAIPIATVLAACIAVPSAAFAEEQPDPPAHPDTPEQEIVVSGHPPVDFSLLASTTNLEGDALVLETRGQLGETLARLPGVSATSFAPGASRPVLRGMDGDRIKVLIDGIGSIDASNVSADHAVVFDPLTTDHIDVLHGPAVLLFGGQAIGGAVNALDKRIPRTVPDHLHVTMLGGYGSSATERSAGGAAQMPLGGNWVGHVDASWRKSDDQRVGGRVLSDALRAEVLTEAAGLRADGESDAAALLEEQADQAGSIANSAARSTTFGAGIAYLGQGGNLGLSVQRYDTRYGVPMRPGSTEEDPVSIDLGQTRVDLRASVDLPGMFESLQVRAAYGDYAHTEFEGDSAGTRFAARGFESRVDLVQRRSGAWRGRSGVQYLARKLTVAGAEAYTPDNDVTRFGAFTLQSLRLGSVEIEGAGRYERSTIAARRAGFVQSYDTWSGAAGASVSPVNGIKLGVNFTRGARAPAPEELLSDGVHGATQSYERGDRSFRPETSDGYEAYIRYERGGASISLTGYRTDFANFIAAAPTGEQLEDVPLFVYRQLPARFTGFEAQAGAPLAQWGSNVLRIDAAADYTRASLRGSGPVPRVPPLRLRGGAELEAGSVRLRGEVEWNARQDRVAAFETKVPSFTLVNLSADWHPLGEDGPLTLMLAANNLLDVVGRRAASVTRDYVPIAGRDLRITAKLDF